NFLDFWSKKESDTLPLYQKANYKIKLTKDNILGFSYLNKHLIKELTAIQEYLIYNLAKGFITLSKAPFIALILFAYKANRSL
ncbi:hypothetical protein OIDMADRAFT_130943, partial [Oidiodendron maius Zn]